MEETRPPGAPGRDVGQGYRDSDPELARKKQLSGKSGGHSDMPDFISGPAYTGQIPPEGDSPAEGDWSAGADVARDSAPGAP